MRISDQFNYVVPSGTKHAAADMVKKCPNLGLVLDRYVPQQVIMDEDVVDNNGNKKDKARRIWLQDQLSFYTSTESALLSQVDADYRRWTTRTQGSERFVMRLQDRMVIGFGSKGALEFGITLHPVTGLPYIPGSALKGLCRTYALLKIAAHEQVQVSIEDDALKALDTAICETNTYASLPLAVRYRLAFGTQQEAGGCVFHDAVLFSLPPEPERLFTLDVMTPHFVKYYTSSGKDAPSDDDKPNPVNYVTVTAGVIFAFAVGKRAGFTDNDKVVLQARDWLRSGLQELGVGAKTAQGYGVFVPA